MERGVPFQCFINPCVADIELKTVRNVLFRMPQGRILVIFINTLHLSCFRKASFHKTPLLWKKKKQPPKEQAKKTKTSQQNLLSSAVFKKWLKVHLVLEFPGECHSGWGRCGNCWPWVRLRGSAWRNSNKRLLLTAVQICSPLHLGNEQLGLAEQLYLFALVCSMCQGLPYLLTCYEVLKFSASCC